MSKKQKLNAAIQRQQALVDSARSANRSLFDSEQAEFDALQREIDNLKPEVEAEERQQQSAAPAATATTTPAAPAATPTPNAEMQRAVEAERTRISEITDLCRTFDMDPTQYINDNASVDNVRAAVIDRLRATRSPITTGVQVTGSGEDEFRRDVSDALMLRKGNLANPSEGARQMAAMSLRDIGIECLSREGRNTNELLRMAPDDLYTELSRQFYNPTAAFPAILDQTIRKSIVELYNRVPTTFQAFTTKGSLKDFKETADHEYVIGGVGDFLLVPENGEIKPDSPRTELLPTRQLKTYGKSFSMTRQAFINDDIGFLTEIPGLYATAAKKTIDKQVYKILFENKAIFDGVALFHDKHNNLIKAGSKPTQASIQSMILKMQQQKDQFGDAIYMTPRTIIVPVGYEFDLSVILHSAQVVGSNNNDVNPLYNYPLQIVQSPVLNALAGNNACPWFMVADSTSARGIQVDYLNGQETPTVRRMETAGQLGFSWDIYLDWGISVRDFRGIAKNPGVAIETV
jgi:hypothetical protein